MKIPKYIDNALTQRTRLACKLNTYCDIVDGYIDKHRIDCETYDTHGGVEIFTNPFASEERIRQAILNHGGDKS